MERTHALVSSLAAFDLYGLYYRKEKIKQSIAMPVFWISGGRNTIQVNAGALLWFAMTVMALRFVP